MSLHSDVLCRRTRTIGVPGLGRGGTVNKCRVAAFVAASLLLTPAMAGAVVPAVDSTFDASAEG
jgi:hypothetical protein